MRLWHQMLLPYLPKEQLLGQHRELCALRGNGFGKKHKTVNYVFSHPYSDLFFFHQLVIKEMKQKGYQVDPLWEIIFYRGKKLGYDFSSFTKEHPSSYLIYKEHDFSYFVECIRNLKGKGITIFPTS